MLCYSYDFIDQQSLEMSVKIKQNTVYKFVRVESAQGDHVGEQKEGPVLISKIILEDKEGTIYSVNPNPNGLKFAKGEITYKEYKKNEKKETNNIIGGFLAVSGCFVLLMGVIVKFII